jgi:hypothetical protein
MDIALFATTISLSIFKHLFHQRFKKHSFLESMLEILQRFYIHMATDPDDFFIFPRDLALYTLRCTGCGKCISPLDSSGETLFHAPSAMLHHWDMIQPNEDMNVNEMMSMALLFTSRDNYLQ